VKVQALQWQMVVFVVVALVVFLSPLLMFVPIRLEILWLRGPHRMFRKSNSPVLLA
jgi:hypothetical protein